MNFSSPLFLFLFLPVVLTVYHCLPGIKARNAWLLAVSLLFYAWGEVGFIMLLAASTLLNHALGRWLERTEPQPRRKRIAAMAIIANLALLAFFKYTNFLVSLLNSALHSLGLQPLPQTHIPLPIGISFFTFHALSYIVDVYRRKWKAASDPKQVALYIFFFPQLVAGPILRWNAIAPQLLQRQLSLEGIAEGIRRFIGGLAKKMLIANTLAVPADQIFALASTERSTPVAWIGIVCYTLQIYFDFSGYSDMAVGLGKMFGFTFIENFQFPYIAQSIRDFWRRWHISLSTWFRDYLYVPLGGNRVSPARTHLNLLLVFFLCGLWHGASLTFVAWGLYHGAFLVLERTRFGSLQEKLPQSLRHLYTLLVVMGGWVLFRADTFAAAGQYFLALLGVSHAIAPQSFIHYTTNQVLVALLFGLLFGGPSWGKIQHLSRRMESAASPRLRPAVQAAGLALEMALLLTLLGLSASWLASGTYNPFIYYRF